MTHHPWLFASLATPGANATGLATDATGLAWAVQEGSTNAFDWAAPWSWSRFAATGVFVLVSLLIAFGLFSRARLNPERNIK